MRLLKLVLIGLLIVLIPVGVFAKTREGHRLEPSIAGKWIYVGGTVASWDNFWFTGTESLELVKGGTAIRTKRILGQAFPEPGTYRFVDDERVKLTFEGGLAGTPISGGPIYRVMVYQGPNDAQELALTDETGASMRFRRL